MCKLSIYNGARQMRKDELINLVRKNEKSEVLCIKLLKAFLQTEQIKKLKNLNDVSFKDYLHFIQQTHPNQAVIELFKEPNLMLASNEAALLLSFMNKEEVLKPILFDNNLEYEFDKLSFVQEPASAIAILPDGNMITSICYIDECGDVTSGEIVLRDSAGNRIRTLVNEPASAIAILPDGNMITSTCGYDDFDPVGEIVLRDADGNRIRTLVSEPAAGLVILPNGNMITSTCFFDAHDVPKGKIVLRGPAGNYIKTLVKQPASAIALPPNGSFMITSTVNFDEKGNPIGHVDVRDLAGNRIKTLLKEPISAIAMLANGNMMTSTCFFDEADEAMGEIAFKRPRLVAKEFPFRIGETALLRGVNKLLLDMATLGCKEFHKGSKQFQNQDVSLLCKLPPELLHQIFSYTFPFPESEKAVVVNASAFPFHADKDIKKVKFADEFANKIFDMAFFKSPKVTESKQGLNNTNTKEDNEPKSCWRSCIIV